MEKRKLMLVWCALGMVWCSVYGAKSIPFQNAGFEEAVVPEFVPGAPYRWLGSSAHTTGPRCGTLNASTEILGLEGKNVAVLITYPDSGLSFIYQDIPMQLATIQKGTFTLKFKVAARSLLPLPDSYSVDFRSLRGTTQTTITPTSITNPTPASGNAVEWIQTYVFDEDSPYLGDAIRVAIGANGSSNGTQSHLCVDQFELSFASDKPYVSIINPSFEDPTITSSPYESATVTGWNESGNWVVETAAIWRSASTWYPGTRGANVLLLRTSNQYPERYSSVWQEVGTVNEGVYTLKAVVARRDASLAFIPNLFLWLCAFNGTSMVALPADEVVAPTPSPNSYQEWSYKVTIPAGSPYIGMPLRVYFGGYGNGGGTVSYAIADNFRLEFQPAQCAGLLQLGYSMEVDLNNDCKVNLSDFAIFAADWLICTTPNDPACEQPWN